MRNDAKRGVDPAWESVLKSSRFEIGPCTVGFHVGAAAGGQRSRYRPHWLRAAMEKTGGRNAGHDQASAHSRRHQAVPHCYARRRLAPVPPVQAAA